MKISQSLLLVSCAVIILVYYAWRILTWVWFRPKKLEKCLRQLGFKGNSYRLLFGDFKEIIKMRKEAKSKPMNFSNNIVPRVIPSFHKTITKYGQDSFLWFGPKPALLIFDTEIIREVLAKSYIFQKPVSPAFKLLIRGLATYETDKWAQHRRLITPSFHLDKLKKMLPCFHASCCDMLSKWEKNVAREGSCELDVWPYLETLTSDVISRSAFGSSYEEGRKIFDLQKEQAELVMLTNRSNHIPGLRFLPTKSNRRMKDIQKEVESLILGIIKKRINKIEAGEACSNDLLSILLESNFKEIKYGNRSGMSFKDVVDECKLFYFAGQETTSSLLVWTLILLSKHLDWQNRAREEVLEAFGRDKPVFQQLNSLKVVTMILNEVLRLYPPAIMLSRMTGENGTLSKLDLPAGVQVFLPILLLHHDCKLWGEDAKEFNPERFSEGVGNATKGQLIYFPFGWGPRVCIGQSFAMLEAKMAMTMILQRYSFELSPSYSHAPHTVVTLQPQHGAHLIMKKLWE